MNRALGVLVIAAAMEEFCGRPQAQRSAERKQQVEARVLEEVVGTHAVERVNLPPFVVEQRDVAASRAGAPKSDPGP